MATLRRKIEVEAKMRQLLADNGLPEPDGIEYGYTCVRLFFNEPKVCVVIDIDAPEDVEDEGKDGHKHEDDRPLGPEHRPDHPLDGEHEQNNPPSGDDHEARDGDEADDDDPAYGYLEWTRDLEGRTSQRESN